MNYQQLQPPAPLAEYVRYFWVLESGTNTVQKTFRTIADGCPGLIFQQPEKGTFYQNEKQLPAIFLFGQSTKYADISLSGQFGTVGVYLHPNALKSVFGLNAEELTDSCLDLNLLALKQGSHLFERLSNTSSTTGQIELLSSYLLRQCNDNAVPTDKAMAYALSRLLESKGTIPLKQVQESLRLSERSLERKFKQYVGISPKLFSRICRFQASLRQLRANNYGKFSDIAFENEYADQSHFIRAFNEFAGFSPYQYQKQSNEVVENLSELIR